MPVGCGRQQFVCEFEPLRAKRGIELADAGDIAAGMIEICHQPDLHGIAGGGEHDRDFIGRLFGRQIGGRIGDDHRDLALHKIGGKLRQATVVAVGPAIFDGDVFTVDKAALLEALPECGDLRLIFLCRGAVDQADHRHGLLGARRKGHQCHAAKQSDEFATLHSITSSARPLRESGTERPELLGALQIQEKLNLRRELHRKVGRLLALEDAAGIEAGVMVGIGVAAAIAHQPAACDELAILVDRRHFQRVTIRPSSCAGW